MKFKKRFLMCLAIVGIILVPSMAKADVNGAVALNKWFRTAPVDADPPTSLSDRTVTSVKRNQTVYFLLYENDDTTEDAQTNQGGTLAPCTFNSPTIGCSSAPLFIASENALVCVDSDTSVTTESDGVVDLYVCSDSSCSRTSSAGPILLLEATKTSACLNSNLGTALNGISLGGSWIYVDVSINPDTAGENILVWVTGR
jgi:hypothetical protein